MLMGAEGARLLSEKRDSGDYAVFSAEELSVPSRGKQA